ncbi:MAG TPA: BlaI/MecI/CopY family transcriptional regulator [Myxococcales bacterium]|nr:BlaI/MecI/CopY family transcriptional regulator [Myxococcales bacterium]
MSDETQTNLSRRERQIMDAIYRLGKASVSEVMDNIPDPPSYSAVRAMLGILETKGHLRHEQEGAKYMYLPMVARERARKTALKSLVQTFFDGSSREAIAALLEMPDGKLSKGELDVLGDLIERAKKEGR